MYIFYYKLLNKLNVLLVKYSIMEIIVCKYIRENTGFRIIKQVLTSATYCVALGTSLSEPS